MPRGPKGEKRPADVIGAAVMVAKIATGEIEDTKTEKNPHAVALGKLGGAKGGKARAASLSDTARKRAAQKAAHARWGDSHNSKSTNQLSTKSTNRRPKLKS
jgi:hypothetical protein